MVFTAKSSVSNESQSEVILRLWFKYYYLITMRGDNDIAQDVIDVRKYYFYGLQIIVQQLFAVKEQVTKFKGRIDL